jgi:hypothetical protein
MTITMENDARIKSVQNWVGTKRAMLRQLNDKVKDPYARGLIKGASQRVSGIESMFLRSALTEKRTTDALSRWLDYTEAVLRLTEKECEKVQGVVAKFGSNVETT